MNARVLTRRLSPLGFTGIRDILFVLEPFPEYATLERLVEDWLKEQRALYDQLTAARAQGKDKAHP